MILLCNISRLSTQGMAGICVDGSAVYKCYDLDGTTYLGEIKEPASGNWIISPVDVTVVIS